MGSYGCCSSSEGYSGGDEGAGVGGRVGGGGSCWRFSYNGVVLMDGSCNNYFYVGGIASTASRESGSDG